MEYVSEGVRAMRTCVFSWPASRFALPQGEPVSADKLAIALHQEPHVAAGQRESSAVVAADGTGPDDRDGREDEPKFTSGAPRPHAKSDPPKTFGGRLVCISEPTS